MTVLDYTHITLVADRSGSMESIRGDAQGGINAFIDDQKTAPGRASLYFVQFDDRHDVVADVADLAGYDGNYHLQPRGWTALYDAVGTAITKTGEKLKAMAESERPAKVLLAIVTDGYENASREYTREAVAAMIEHQKTKYGWEVVYLSADPNAVTAAQAINIDRNHTVAFAATGISTANAYNNFSNATRVYRGSAGGQSMPVMPDLDADGEAVTTP